MKLKLLKMFSIDDYISTKENFTTITTTVKIQNSNTKKIVEAFKENPNIIVIDRKVLYVGDGGPPIKKVLQNNSNYFLFFEKIVCRFFWGGGI